MDGNTSSPRARGLRRSNSLSSPRTNVLTEKNRHKSLTYSPSIQPRPTQSLPLASQTGSSSSGVHSASDEEDDDDDDDPDVAVLQELVRRVDIESPVEGNEERRQQRRRRRSSSRFATTPVHLSPDQFAQLIRCGSPLSQQHVATSAPSSPSSSRRHLLNTEEFRAAIVTSPIATTATINESSF